MTTRCQKRALERRNYKDRGHIRPALTEANLGFILPLVTFLFAYQNRYTLYAPDKRQLPREALTHVVEKARAGQKSAKRESLQVINDRFEQIVTDKKSIRNATFSNPSALFLRILHGTGIKLSLGILSVHK